ncbi:Putative serine/threonine-protein kinase-like protein CCR3 [Linum perenne]
MSVRTSKKCCSSPSFLDPIFSVAFCRKACRQSVGDLDLTISDQSEFSLGASLRHQRVLAGEQDQRRELRCRVQGELSDGSEVEIKRGETNKKANKYQEKESTFESELSFLSKLHHKHLVRLVGYCEDGADMAT